MVFELTRRCGGVYFDVKARRTTPRIRRAVHVLVARICGCIDTVSNACGDAGISISRLWTKECSMLFHLSVEADEPKLVAEALAEIMGGEAFPFPPVGVGSWVALAGDDRGTMIEIYARGTELYQSEGGAIGVEKSPRRHSATHFAMATPLGSDAIFALAERRGWTAKYCRRADRFGLIEMWIEDCLMIEVLTTEMQREYLDTITIANWRRMIEEGAPAEEVMADAA